MKAKLLTLLLCLCTLTVCGQVQISKPTKQTMSPQKNKSKSTPKPKPASPKKSEPTGYENGHGYVDLGLSVKWATCNVGANSPEEYGDYFAWGETKPKSTYNYTNCFDCLDSKGNNWNIYKIGGKTQITPTSGHDTARENWGGSWRMPTYTECEELCKKCKWTWTSINGHNGYTVTGPNGNCIFLPAAGHRYSIVTEHVDVCGYYWSSTLHSEFSDFARSLSLKSRDHYAYNYGRGDGQSVRPVTD